MLRLRHTYGLLYFLYSNQWGKKRQAKAVLQNSLRHRSHTLDENEIKKNQHQQNNLKHNFKTCICVSLLIVSRDIQRTNERMNKWVSSKISHSTPSFNFTMHTHAHTHMLVKPLPTSGCVLYVYVCGCMYVSENVIFWSQY